MSFNCPGEGCGRKFEEKQLREHIQRRHKQQAQELMQKVFSTTFMSREQKKDQDLGAKFPRLLVGRSQSKDKKNPGIKLELKAKPKIVAGPRVSDIITNSRIQVNTNSTPPQTAVSQPQLIRPLLRKLPQLGNKHTQQRSMIQQTNNPYQIRPELSETQSPTLANTLSRKSLRQKSRSKEKLGIPKPSELLMQTATDGFNLQKNQEYFAKTTNPALSKTSSGSLSLKNLGSVPQATTKKNILKRHNSKEKRLGSSKNLEPVTEDKSMAQSTFIPQQQVRNPKDVGTAAPKEFDPTEYEQSSVLVIKKPIHHFSPPFNCIEYLSLNNLGLRSLTLEGLEFLTEFSATNNQLVSMDFLDYEGNGNLRQVHLSHNQISRVVMLPGLEILTLAFNRLDDLQQVCTELTKNKVELREVDFSLNPVQKLYNYKYEVVLASKALKVVDGIKLTKFDIDLALQYRSLVQPHQSKDIVLASKSYYQRFVQEKLKPEDSHYLLSQGMTEEQYNNLQKEYQDILSKTQQVQEGLQTVRQENQVLQEELQSIQVSQAQKQDVDNELMLLQGELEVLEFLHLMRFSAQDQIQSLIESTRAKLVY